MNSREIQISSRCEYLEFDPIRVEKWIHSLEETGDFPIPPGDLSIVFLDDAQMAELHGTFLGDPSATDVITFPGDPAFEEAGEICVGAQQAHRVFQSHQSTFSDEILLYLAHGWLHLAGYDDHTEEDRRNMRSAEQSALRSAAQGADRPVFHWVAQPSRR